MYTTSCPTWLQTWEELLAENVWDFAWQKTLPSTSKLSETPPVKISSSQRESSLAYALSASRTSSIKAPQCMQLLMGTTHWHSWVPWQGHLHCTCQGNAWSKSPAWRVEVPFPDDFAWAWRGWEQSPEHCLMVVARQHFSREGRLDSLAVCSSSNEKWFVEMMHSVQLYWKQRMKETK